MEQWEAIDNDESLALFHAKFWGKGMAIEEEEWSSTQPPVADIGSELKGTELDGERPIGKAVDGKTDGDRTDLDSDDIIAGCYMLDIGIDDFPFPKIWVRADYIRIFDYLQAYYDWPRAHDIAPAVVITGQPGIGKSVWVYYALHRCLAESKPVIWCYRGACYLFVEEGVYQMPTDFEIQGFVWTLVDSDSSSEGVLAHLADHGTRHFIIYSTAPCKERWSRLHKTMRVTVVIMNPWTRAEIVRAALLFPDRKFTNDSINEIFDQLGPTPRLCLDYQYIPDRLAAYSRDLTTAIAKATPPEIEGLLKAAESLSMDSISQTICLVRRAKQDEVASWPVVTVITPTVQSRLANKFQDLPRDELPPVRVPESRAVSG